MKVSVIITTFKRPYYLSEAIESVLKQNFKDFELIIVDDNPDSKETEKIIQLFHDPRVVYMKNKENLGGAKSLNIGLKKAKGEYVAILDDDDVWLSEDKLEKQVLYLDEKKDYVIVGTKSIVIDEEKNKKIAEDMGWQEIKNIRNFLFFGSPFAHSSALYRRKSALSVGGYDESLPRGKDLNLYFRLSRLGKFGFIGDCLIKHREILRIERDFIETRRVDSFFHREVIRKYRTANLYFWVAYFRLTVRYYIFVFLKRFPFFYYLYRMLRYSKRDLIFTLKIPSINRISLDLELIPLLKKINTKSATLLEIGSSPDENYKKYIPHKNYLTLDIEKRNKPDICCDVTDIKWESNYFDVVVAIEVLEHVHSPEKAAREIWRVLKPGGICVLSTRFLHYYHPGPKDYYRFTWDSLNYIFRDFKKIEIYHHGNKIQCIWHILSEGKIKVILNIFNPLFARLKSKKTKFPLGFIVFAQK